MLPEPLNPIPWHYEPKTTWRAWAKAQRSFVCSSAASQHQLEQQMITHLEAFIKNNAAFETIGLYAPMPLEPNLLGLIKQFPQKQWVFPRIGQTAFGQQTSPLFFHTLPASLRSAITNNSLADNFIQTAWGLWEPPPEWQQPLRIDLLIIPALAMDVTGVRLGYGGGFFDRWLALQPQKPETIGVCWEACKVEKLPREAFDVPLAAICTETDSLFAC